MTQEGNTEDFSPFDFTPFLSTSTLTAADTAHDLFFANPFDVDSVSSIGEADSFDPIPQAILFTNSFPHATAPALSPLQPLDFDDEPLADLILAEPPEPTFTTTITTTVSTPTTTTTIPTPTTTIPTPTTTIPIPTTEGTDENPLGACSACHKAKKQCDQKRPCARCLKMNKPEGCTERPRKRKPKRALAKIRIAEGLPPKTRRKKGTAPAEAKLPISTQHQNTIDQLFTGGGGITIPEGGVPAMLNNLLEQLVKPPSPPTEPSPLQPAPSSSSLPPGASSCSLISSSSASSTSGTTTEEVKVPQPTPTQEVKEVKEQPTETPVLKAPTVPLVTIKGATLVDCPKMKEEMADPIHQINLKLFNLHIQDLFDVRPSPQPLSYPPRFDYFDLARVLPTNKITLRIVDEKAITSPYHAAIGVQISLGKRETWQFSVDYIVNSEAEKLFGYSREECITHIQLHHKQFISRLIAREDWPKVARVQSNAWTDGAPGFRLTVTCVDKFQKRFKCVLDARVELHYEVNPKEAPVGIGPGLLSSLPPIPTPPTAPLPIREQMTIHDKGEQLYTRWIAVKRVIFFFVPVPSD